MTASGTGRQAAQTPGSRRAGSRVARLLHPLTHGRANGRRRIWFISFAAFFLMATAFALALPIEGNTDEIAHAQRAYAVATGQWLGHPSHAILNRPGALFRVPRSLVPLNAECMFHPSVVASCQRWTGDTTAAVANSWTGRYSPLYYLPVGLPMRVWPHEAGVIAGRIVSAAMSALLLATATTLATFVRSRLLVLAVLVAATPSAVNLAGAINPNGFEISAGILFWTCAVVMLRGPDTGLAAGRIRRVADWAAVAGFVLLTTRALGPVWCAATLGAAALLADRAHLRQLRAIGGWPKRFTLLALGGFGGLAWNLAAHNFEYYRVATVDADRRHGLIGRTLAENISGVLNVRSEGWLRGVVGVAGQADYSAPLWLDLAWYGLVFAVVSLAMLTAARRWRLVIGAIGAATFLLTAVLELRYVQVLGWTQVSRYFLPFFAGMWILAGGAVPTGAVPADAERRLLRTASTVMAVCQLAWLVLVMNRYQNGPFATVDPFHGAWLPAVGPLPPLLVMAAGLGFSVWLVRWTRLGGQAFDAAETPLSRFSRLSSSMPVSR